MSIRLIALDLDGTLLNSNKELSEGNLAALSEAAAQGIWIVPCTGRSVTGLAPQVRDLPFVRYVITINGAAVIDRKDNDKKISYKPFSKEQAAAVWNYVKKYNTLMDAQIDGRNCIEPALYERIPEFAWDEIRVRMMRTLRNPTPGMDQAITEGKIAAEKINLFFSRERIGEREAAREELGKIPYVMVTSSLPNNLELNYIEATKGNGLRALAAHLGLDISETMACGDSYNDLTMLKAAGLGVAMKNSDPPAFEAADVVTASNDEDGVALAIRKWALNQEVSIP